MQGIYFFANDKMLDWVVAFLKSLRIHMPNIPIYMIPFDYKIDKLAKLKSKYRFNIIDEANFFDLDKIAMSFHQHYYGKHALRKFFVFWGPLDSFLFLDADIVILDDLKDLFDLGPEYDMVFEPTKVDYVYTPGSLRERIIREDNGKWFSAGVWRGKKGQFTFNEIKAFANQAMNVKEQFASKGDQSFLNFCVYEKKVKATTFQEISYLGFSSPKLQNKGDKRRLKLIHWAGFKLNPAIPHRSLFLHYRLMHMSPFNQIIYRSVVWCKYIIYLIRKLLGRILKMPLKLDPKMPYREALNQYKLWFLSILHQK